MNAFSLADLQDIVCMTLGDSGLHLAPEGTAADVPGWDSLQHTLIVLAINQRLGIDLQPAEAAAVPDFAALVALINRRAGQPT